MKLKRRRQRRRWQTCCKTSQYWTWAVLGCSIWALTKFPRGRLMILRIRLKKKNFFKATLFDAFRSDSTHSTQLGVCSLSQFIVWKSIFWPQQSAALHPVFSLSICAGVSPAPWGTPPALPWVYPCCHGNTLQSHRPKYPKLRIISWQDVSERVPYRTRRVSAVFATAAAHSALDRKVWLLTFENQVENWTLLSAVSVTESKAHLNCTLNQYATYSHKKTHFLLCIFRRTPPSPSFDC